MTAAIQAIYRYPVKGLSPEQLEPLYQRSLAISKKLDGEKSQGYASALSQYGSYLFSRNEYSAAQRTYEQVLKIQQSIAPAKDDYSTLGALQMLGNLYWQTNQHQKAIAMFDRWIDASLLMIPASWLWVWRW